MNLLRLILSAWFMCVLLSLTPGGLQAQVESAKVNDMPLIRLGIVSDENTRDLEDMLLVRLQQNPQFIFLERTQLPKRIQELSLQDFLAKAQWDSCDVLILLNAFASDPAGKDRQLIVRFISTHTLQTLGLWVYPMKGAEISALALILASRIEPVLTRKDAFGEQKAVSVSLLRAETPSLKALTESATYLLAAQIQNRPGLSLIERWNVRDPSFEQWLRQTEPTNVKPPDLFVEGFLTEVNSKPGLRLNINGTFKPFDATTGAPSLEAATAAAAATIARDTGASPAARTIVPEFTRFEKDARWFWKWAAFRQAAVSADVAVYLGCASRETLYIRALASLHSRRGWAYVSNLNYADTPSADDLQNVLYGLERFLEIVPPAASASPADRRLHLGYSEDALQWAGELLQGLYFSELELPGTETERSLLRKLTFTLATRTIAYSASNTKPDRSYPNHLENIDNVMMRKLPELLANYGCFMVDDPEELISLYVASFEEAARAGASGMSNGMPSDMFGSRALNSHYPWIADWDRHAPDDPFFEKFVSRLTDHRKPEVRILAYLMPAGYSPPKPPAKISLIRREWASWAIQRLSKEDGFLAANPTKYSFQLLACVGKLMGETREQLKDAFPEAAWRACLTSWIAAVHSNSREEYAGHTGRYLQSLMNDSLKSPGANSTPVTAPTDDEIVSIYRFFTLAPPPLSAKTRKVRSEALNQRIQELAANQPPPGAARHPSVETNLSPRPLPLKAWSAESPATGPARLSPELIFSDESWGKPICTARGETGTNWFMLWDSSREILTFAEVDASFQSISRIIKVHDFDSYYYNWQRAKMVVYGGSIYCVTPERLYKVTPGEEVLQSLALAKMDETRIWSAGGRLWVTGHPGLIYEYLPKEDRLKLISSSMRSPATNALDARNAYGVTTVFDHEGAIYALVDDRELYRRDEATGDWQQVYRTSNHLRANQPYPVELLWKAVGNEIRISSAENILDVLALDPGFSGILRTDYRSYPIRLRTPDGTEVFSSDLRKAAVTETALWVVFQSSTTGCNLGAWQKSTGTTFSYPLRFPKLVFPQSLTALPGGFLFDGGNGKLFYLSRAKITVSK